MYNTELKKIFISERVKEATLPENYLERTFEQISVMENKLQKDCSNFSYYEIMEYYKMINVKSVGGLQVLNSQLSIYTDWCLKQNIVNDNQNHYLEIRLDDYYSCINKALANLSIFKREDVLEWISELPNYSDQFILLALFEGLRGKENIEISMLKPEHVCGNMIILPDGKEIDISNDLAEIIENVQNTYIYYSMSEELKQELVLVDSGFIIKNQKNVKEDSVNLKGTRVRRAIQKALNYLGLKHLKAQDFYNSGMIHRIKVNAERHGMSSVDYIHSEYFGEIEKIYGKVPYKNGFIKKYEDCL